MTASISLARKDEPFNPYLQDTLDDVRQGRTVLLFLLNLPTSERQRFPEDYDAAIDYVGRQLASDIYIAQENLEIAQQRIMGESQEGGAA